MYFFTSIFKACQWTTTMFINRESPRLAKIAVTYHPNMIILITIFNIPRQHMIKKHNGNKIR